MTETFVLHLRSSRLAAGDVQGVVEVIATGERRTVASLAELSDVLTQRGEHQPADRPGSPIQT